MIMLLKVALMNLLLSSDNVLMIALFSQGLHKTRRVFALSCSLVASVALQLGILFVVAILFRITFLQSLFGLLICYMAVKLLRQPTARKPGVERDTVWYTVGKIVIGNLMMSFENEAALISLSGGNVWIAWIGVVATSPIIFFGSHLMALLLERYDFILYIGSVILFKIGLGLVFTLPVLKSYARIGGWGLTVVFALIVAGVYLHKRGVIDWRRIRA